MSPPHAAVEGPAGAGSAQLVLEPQPAIEFGPIEHAAVGRALARELGLDDAT